MKKIILIAVALIGLTGTAQVKIGTNPTIVGASSLLELESTTKGFLPPRLTTIQRDAIVSPVAGLAVFNTTKNCLEWYNGTIWYNGCGIQDPGLIGTLACLSATTTGSTFTGGRDLSGVSISISYTGGNGGSYTGQTIASTGAVTGLTATLAAGNFAFGSGSLIYSLTGSPIGSGTATFPITIGGQTCNLTTDTGGCGAYVAAGVYKLFMCHNLGANNSLDPNVAVQGIHGNYYQWGRNTVAADTSTSSGTISGWNTTSAANGSWTDASKTANDPCPTGFRVPTISQWQNVIANNTKSSTGAATTWIATSSNWGSSVHFGPDASHYTLTLPAAGYRHTTAGALVNRGYNGYYWSSTESGTLARYLSFFSGSVNASTTNRRYGLSVRCVSE